MDRLRRFYGASPLHLLSLLACFALTGYVVSRLAGNPSLPRMLAWFLGAVIAHDLVAFPIYAYTDRVLACLACRRSVANDAEVVRTRGCVSAINHIRIPALASLLLLLVYLPGIVRQGGATYRAATGQTQQPFLSRWLLFTALFFGASAIAYAARLVHARRQQPPGRSDD